MRDNVRVEYINVGEGLILLDTGDAWPITGMLDDEGKECSATDNPIVIVAGSDRTGVVTLRVNEFEPVCTH